MSTTALDNPELEHAWNTLHALRNEIGKAVIGQPAIIDQVLVALLAAGHVLIEGVPGLGKTLLGQALAKCIRGKFARIQFTADLMPSDVTGHAIYNMRSETFEIRRGPVFCHLLLADEINRAPAKTQASLLEVMQEGQVTIEGQTFPLEPPFLVLATQNPIEQEGTYPLPEAQLDRFMLNIRIDYPAPQEEIAMVQAVTLGQVGDRLDVSRLQPLLEPAAILALQQASAGLTIDPQVLAYAVRIVATSRDFPGIAVGASPRGGIALVRAARARALLEGRDFVTPDDIKVIAKAALRHRLILAAAFEMEGRLVDQVIDDLLERVEAPRR